MLDTKYFPNKYAKKCCKCGTVVLPSAGVCFKADQAWQVGCRSCFPSEASYLYSAGEAFRAAEALKAEQLEARRLQLIADRKVLIEKLGIEFDKPFDTKTSQQSWSDDSTWKVRYTRDGTDEEFRCAVQTPCQSLYGQLRASGGTSLTCINREDKTLTLFESVRLCD